MVKSNKPYLNIRIVFIIKNNKIKRIINILRI